MEKKIHLKTNVHSHLSKVLQNVKKITKTIFFSKNYQAQYSKKKKQKKTTPKNQRNKEKNQISIVQYLFH
jgi:hypothetical protein